MNCPCCFWLTTRQSKPPSAIGANAVNELSINGRERFFSRLGSIRLVWRFCQN